MFRGKYNSAICTAKTAPEYFTTRQCSVHLKSSCSPFLKQWETSRLLLQSTEIDSNILKILSQSKVSLFSDVFFFFNANQIFKVRLNDLQERTDLWSDDSLKSSPGCAQGI